MHLFQFIVILLYVLHEDPLIIELRVLAEYLFVMKYVTEILKTLIKGGYYRFRLTETTNIIS